MKIKKVYLLIVLFLCGLSAENLFAAAAPTPTWADWTRLLHSRAGAAAAAAEGYLGEELREATRKENKAEVKRLIAAGADVNATESSYDEYTALIYAVIYNNLDIAQLLLDAKADVNARGYYGITALRKAAELGHDDIVKMLLDAKADVNTVNLYGYTALMYAAEYNRKNIVKQLLDVGADKTIKNNRGQTAETLARDNLHEELADMIRDYILPLGRTIKSALKK